jgi:hypothetical protein
LHLQAQAIQDGSALPRLGPIVVSDATGPDNCWMVMATKRGGTGKLQVAAGFRGGEPFGWWGKGGYGWEAPG